MKRVIVALFWVFILGIPAHAFQIVTDEVEFSHWYNSPLTIIDFDVLQDDTSFPITVHQTPQSPYFAGRSTYQEQTAYYSIRENGFSDEWWFRSNTGSSGGAYTSVWWFDGGIYGEVPQGFWLPHYIDVFRAGRDVVATSFSMETNVGFVGIIPDAGEILFDLRLAGVERIYEFRADYSSVATPEPSTFIFLSIGLLGLYCFRKRMV